MNAQQHDGNTALHCAARRGRVDTMRVLLEHGADPIAVNSAGRTPLMELSMTVRNGAWEAPHVTTLC